MYITKRIESPEPSATFVSKKFVDPGDDSMCDAGDLSGEGEAEGSGKPPNGASCDVGSDNEEQEDVGDYCKGGYHPVKIGDLYNQRYFQ